MSAPEQPLAAVHYFYLLKDDEESVATLWSRLSFGAPMPEERLADLGLAQAAPSISGYCTIVRRLAGPEFDLCLLALPNLSVLELLYHSDTSQPLPERWRGALARLNRHREMSEEGLAIFGETTVLVSSEPESGLFRETAAELSGSDLPLLRGYLDPARAGGGTPVLFAAPAAGTGQRQFFALSAPAPEEILSDRLPQMDYLIKKLTRSSAYFREQRHIIITEREGVDKEVGGLLHRQVMVRATGKRPDAEGLERQIDSLSRMFGILATDTLLVRQAGDALQKDIRSLKNVLDAFIRGDDGDQMRPYYLEQFRAELEPVLDEVRNLDLSRQNALAAIEVVRTQVSLLRAGEEAGIQEQTRELLSRSLVLQKERLSLQVAAGFIEFVVIFYYLLSSWEGVVGIEAIEHIAPLLRLLLVGGTSAGAALMTHYLAQFLQKRSFRSPGLWISAVILVLSLTGMVIVSL